MSAFLVDKATIDRAVYLIMEAQDGSYGRFVNDREVQELFNIPTYVAEGLPTREDLLGYKLWSLNVLAVEGRYPDTKGGNGERNRPGPIGLTDADIAMYRYTAPALKGVWVVGGGFEPAPLPILQLFKSLRCLAYQCTEDAAVDTTEYKALEAVSSKVAHAIVSALPGYDKAEWA